MFPKADLQTSGLNTDRATANNKYYLDFLNQHEQNYKNTMRKLEKNGQINLFQKSLKEFVNTREMDESYMRKSRALL